MKLIRAWLILAALAGWSCAQETEPFQVAAHTEATGTGQGLVVEFTISSNHFLYAESVAVTALEGGILEPRTIAQPARIQDPFSGEEKEVFKSGFRQEYSIMDWTAGVLRVEVQYQGCSADTCFMPAAEEFTFQKDGATVMATGVAAPLAATPPRDVPAWQKLADQFEIKARTTGYLDAEQFLAFLEGTAAIGPLAAAGDSMSLADAELAPDQAVALFQRWGLWKTLLLILLGGLALNLTPCVLPMIPINLAIIGAGAQGRSRGQGLLLGGVYGLAMALAYGGLGLVVVLTGSQFGTLNASPWFNAVMAAVFLVLGLAMFDLVHVDFSRFQGRWGRGRAGGGQAGRLGLAFSMGVTAALLAGACVAPVVIAVLLLATELHSQGWAAALLLPFVLGAGMGLPWPLAGAGLAFLPKPGRWMTWVKYLFGVLIIAMAVYYGSLAWRLSRPPAAATAEGGPVLAAALEQALADRQPVVLEFWATWCKSCMKMKKTTFKEPRVALALQKRHFVEVSAEHPADPATAALLDYFGVRGLPTIILLEPR